MKPLSLRHASAAVLLLGLLATCGSGKADFSWTRLDRHFSREDAQCVAVAPDGAVHRVFIDREGRLCRSRLAGRVWREAVLDDRPSSVGTRSAAVAPDGRLHATYVVDAAGGVGEPEWMVLHGVLEEAEWMTTELMPGADRGTLAFGPDGHPRILFHTDWTLDEEGVARTDAKRLRYATFDGSGWTVRDTGLRASSSSFGLASSLALDGEGHAHALVSRDWYRQFYATDASGTWEEVPLPFEPARGSLVLGSSGLPHVVGRPFGTGADDSLRHAWYDGITWQEEEILEGGDARHAVGEAALLVGGTGRLQVLFTEAGNDLIPTVSILRFAYEDGTRWREAAPGRGSFSPAFLSAALGTDGSVHALCAGASPPRAAHLRVALPDLQPEPEGSVGEVRRGGTRIRGTVVVRNSGPGRSRPARIRFYLSEDGVLDGEDRAVDRERRVGGIRTGGRRRLRYAVGSSAAAPGEYLLAVIDPDGIREDADRTNNVVAIPLAE